ncbi:promotilin-like [Pseudonaja textilis]|uniref:Promotilin n=1 Tax=Notechis scutatus TaxID=8663 RepID=A0A6J1V646_9SAUR|nr:promotilin [Notechis scutatus]XP_026572645.1 promotilin-like [Pseudonaja textilis]XP_026573911.1 promotilin-like [Pseudonaja textilis]
MVPKKMITSLLLLYITAMMVKESEGYLAFYSREDFRRMQEKEKNQAQKKLLDTRDIVEVAEDEGQVIKMIAPIEIGIHLSFKQLEKYQDVLKELLTEVSDTKNGTTEILKLAFLSPWKLSKS